MRDDEPLVEVVAPARGRQRSVSPALQEAQHPAPYETSKDDAKAPPAVAVPRLASPPSSPQRRGVLARSAGAVSRGTKRGVNAVGTGLHFLLRLLLRLLVFAVFAILRLAQLAAFLATMLGMPYALSGPATVLAVASTTALLSLKLPLYGLRTPGRAAAGAADVALLALAGAMLADHCGCRGGAPLPAMAYKAGRAASAATMHLAHAPGPAELAYHAYTAACDLVC